MKTPAYTHRGTLMSTDNRYRYELTRGWEPQLGGSAGSGVLWIMLNPFTADALVDDQTIRRCAIFTRSWGLSHLKVVNLYALRSSTPAALEQDPDPIGPENLSLIRFALTDEEDRYPQVIAAWGANAGPNPAPARALMYNTGRQVDCLGTTKDGAPRHPSRVPDDLTPVPYWPARNAA